MTIAADEALNPLKVVMRHQRLERLVSALHSLNRRERIILCMRHGIGCDEYTLAEIAAYEGVSRERIRQIECKAIRKLRHPNRSVPVFEADGDRCYLNPWQRATQGAIQRRQEELRKREEEERRKRDVRILGLRFPDQAKGAEALARIFSALAGGR